MHHAYMLFNLIVRPPPSTTLFPYTTLFRSVIATLATKPERDDVLTSFVRRVRPPALGWRKIYEKAQLAPPPTRSEEHTSELQSQSNLVCRLLLGKKKFQRMVLPHQRRLRFT